MSMIHNCIVMVVLVGCGSVSEDHDDVPPTIVSVTPPTDSIVAEDVTVVITFSEPMDTASVESGLVLPMDATSVLAWNSTATELTITPGIQYPAGSDAPTVAKRQYDLVVTGADEAGNVLAAPEALHYTMKFRRITTPFPFTQTLSGNCSSSCSGTFTYFSAGESIADPAVTTRGFLTIPFTLPDGITIESAKLNTEIEVLSDNPFADVGSLFIDHLVFTAINSASFIAPGSELGTLFAHDPLPVAGNMVSFDVTASFQGDYDNRAAQSSRTQYRIRFGHDLTSDANYSSYHSDDKTDLVRMLRPATNVTVTYLVE